MSSAGIGGQVSCRSQTLGLAGDTTAGLLGSRDVGILIALLFLGGSLLNAMCYRSLEPILVGALAYCLGFVLLTATPAGGAPERKIFSVVFTVGWLMAGVAAFYANFLDDPSQNTKDAASFYELASGTSSEMSMQNLRAITEGAGAVVLWRTVYDAVASLGFEKGRYLGVLVNVLAVAFSGVLGIKMTRLVFGDDAARFDRLTALVTLCGMFWLFTALHLRDGVILLGVSSLAYLWTRYIARPRLGSFVILLAGTAAGLAFFGFLRTEFFFIPLAMMVAGVVAGLGFGESRALGAKVGYFLAALGLIVGSVVLVALQGQLIEAVTGGYLQYLQLSTEDSPEGSLGMALIMNQPLPVRLVFGTASLFLYPVPVWNGLQLESAYHLFKAFNALFFYGLIPLVALSVLHLLRQRSVRTPQLMFLGLVAIGSSLGVAGTSLEGRHAGAFYIPLLVFALLPDLTVKTCRNAYKSLLYAFLTMVVVVHISWIYLRA